MNKAKDRGQLLCDTCGCLHFGSYGCIYEKLSNDPKASEEQRINAREHIRLHMESKGVVSTGYPLLDIDW